MEESTVMITSEKRKQSLEDRISQLSDDILVYILSYLTLKEAVRTSILSRRWKDVWKYTRKLDFESTAVSYKVPDKSEYIHRIECSRYVKWVDRVLESHRACKLDELRVSFEIWRMHQTSVSKWVQYAFAKGVERLELDLLGEGQLERLSKYFCAFPDALCVCKWTPLPESYFNYFHFRSLRDLCLKGINVSGEVLEYFICNCPLLERLVVHGSGTLVNVEVIGQSLKLTHLEICHCSKSELIKVSNANLVSLVVKAAGKFQLHNVPMLIEVSVSDQDYPEDELLVSDRDYLEDEGSVSDHDYLEDYYVKDVFSRLSCCLSQLEVLTLEISDYKIDKMEHEEFPELSKLKQLVLVTGAWSTDRLIGITSLMKACPFLHKFVLKFQMSPRSGSEIFKKASGSPFHHLKVIEWSGYYGYNFASELELLMYIVENATALEKIVIDPIDRWCSPIPKAYYQINWVQDATRHIKEQLRVIPQNVEVVIL